jgi:hypothetical protein
MIINFIFKVNKWNVQSSNLNCRIKNLGFEFLVITTSPAITNWDRPINNWRLKLFIFNFIKFDLNHSIYNE